MGFKEVKIEDIKLNPFTAFGKEWMALSAGNEKGSNAMTIAWGHFGSIWDKQGGGCIPTAIVYVRPQRYTKVYMDKEEYFTLSILDNKKALGYLGSHSGRDMDKLKNAGLTPYYVDGTTGIEEASMIFICKKIYVSELKENQFVDPSIVTRNYPKKDFHTIYIGEIVKILQKN